MDQPVAAPRPLEPAAVPAPAGLRVGHAHLRVADLERSVAFYRETLGLDVMQRFGDRAAFLSADGYHHHLAVNTWGSLGGTPPPAGHTGLFHVAFLYPSRAALGAAVARVLAAGVRLTGKADHGVSEAVYFDAPDANGIELCRDRPREEWPIGPDGTLAMGNAALDLDALLAAADEGRP
ncbi:MAG: VOC family protein [Paracoccaceae bacterium]